MLVFEITFHPLVKTTYNNKTFITKSDKVESMLVKATTEVEALKMFEATHEGVVINIMFQPAL